MKKLIITVALTLSILLAGCGTVMKDGYLFGSPELTELAGLAVTAELAQRNPDAIEVIRDVTDVILSYEDSVLDLVDVKYVFDEALAEVDATPQTKALIGMLSLRIAELVIDKIAIDEALQDSEQVAIAMTYVRWLNANI